MPTHCIRTSLRLAVVCIVTVTLLMLVAVFSRADSHSQLVVVSYAGWAELQGLAASGLQILNYQGGVLAAICDDQRIAALRQAGHAVHILDAPAVPSEYYLAYTLTPADLKAIPSLAAVYAYADGVHIVRASVGVAESLPMQGVDIVRLPASITLPRYRPPNARLATSSCVEVRTMLDQVSPALLTEHICHLQDRDTLPYCNEKGTRYSYATAELGEAAQYLYDQYTSFGLSVRFDPFLHNGTPMTNVVAELPGIGPGLPHIYVASAHYDSISEQPFDAAPGADDNASGVAAVLEAARILSEHGFPRTLRFIHFAGEEQGLLGSAHYAQGARERGEMIDGVINVDMIGFESVPPSDHIVELHAGTNPLSIALADALALSVQQYDLELAPQQITSQATWRSDHGSFWGQGFPAVLAIEDLDDFNPHYHSSDDTLAHVQSHMVVEFTKALVATLAQLACQANEPELTPTATSGPALFSLYLPLARPSLR